MGTAQPQLVSSFIALFELLVNSRNLSKLNNFPIEFRSVTQGPLSHGPGHTTFQGLQFRFCPGHKSVQMFEYLITNIMWKIKIIIASILKIIVSKLGWTYCTRIRVIHTDFDMGAPPLAC